MAGLRPAADYRHHLPPGWPNKTTFFTLQTAGFLASKPDNVQQIQFTFIAPAGSTEQSAV
jgi:hypothetical protein